MPMRAFVALGFLVFGLVDGDDGVVSDVDGGWATETDASGKECSWAVAVDEFSVVVGTSLDGEWMRTCVINENGVTVPRSNVFDVEFEAVCGTELWLW